VQAWGNARGLRLSSNTNSAAPAAQIGKCRPEFARSSSHATPLQSFIAIVVVVRDARGEEKQSGNSTKQSLEADVMVGEFIRSPEES
jgi:hypothetical protein